MAARYAFSSVATPDAPARGCDHPGCAAEGSHRAPKSRQDLTSYYWFCIDHVRAYNAAWNYYAGMDETEIERELRRDTVWQRPTWPLGGRLSSRHFSDPLDTLFGDHKHEHTPKKADNTPERKALDTFGLEIPFDLAELKRRYKVLVKRHHPDANGGDRAAEEKLKYINQAYTLLKPRAVNS